MNDGERLPLLLLLLFLLLLYICISIYTYGAVPNMMDGKLSLNWMDLWPHQMTSHQLPPLFSVGFLHP